MNGIQMTREEIKEVLTQAIQEHKTEKQIASFDSLINKMVAEVSDAMENGYQGYREGLMISIKYLPKQIETATTKRMRDNNRIVLVAKELISMC